MNKLTDVIIDLTNSKITFTLPLTAKIDEPEFMVFVDECDNVDNMYSDQSQDHTYYFNVDNSKVTMELGDNYVYYITIEHEIIANMDNHIKYFKVISGNENYITEGIYYSPEVLFNAELTHIKKVCYTCLDNKCMQLIMYVVFKRLLLESSLKLDDYKLSMVFYNDLCRLLEISVNGCCNKLQQDNCITCVGGCCSLK